MLVRVTPVRLAKTSFCHFQLFHTDNKTEKQARFINTDEYFFYKTV